MRKIAAIDVDLTVVDTLTPWLDWFFKRTGEHVKNDSGQYDLIPEMNEIITRVGCDKFDPFDFWKDAQLYHRLQPLDWSLLALYELDYVWGYDVVFVSSCVPEHTASKKRFLEKWFPFAKGFIATHEKHFVDYELLVDDKLEHIIIGKQARPLAKHFLFTGVRADGTVTQRCPHNILRNWGEINAKLDF